MNRNFRIYRIMWTLALGAAMTVAFAYGDNRHQDAPKPPPPVHNEAPRQQSAPPTYVPRATPPVQHVDNGSRQQSAPPRYVPWAGNQTHSTQSSNGNQRADGPAQQSPRQNGPQANGSQSRSDEQHLSNWVPRAGDPAHGSFHTGELGAGAGQGPGNGQQGQQGQGYGRGQGYQQGGQQGGYSRGQGYGPGTGRSGQSNYQGSNNFYNGQSNRPYWSPPPVVTIAQFRQEQLAELHDAHSVYGEHARRGYYGYNRRWRDAQFTYPFYVFDPYDSFGLVSPWYFYPSLPAYIEPSRCLFVNVGALPVFSGAEYTAWPGVANAAYQQGYNQGYQDGQANAQQGQAAPADNRILDGALDDIVAVFKADDQRSLDRLVGETGDVNIYVEGKYSYSLAANDFYDLIRDNANTTQTVDYQILDVKTNGDEAKVIALHTFKDPWGDTEKVYHTYTLKLGQRGAQIIEYGTSASRPTD